MKLVSRSGIWLALKILFFPAIIILAVNIENLATKLGLSSILADHAGTIMADILAYILGIVRSDWVQMPALLIVGGAVALWLDRLLRREEVTLIEAQAELAKQNRLAEKGKQSSSATDNSSPQPATNIIFPPTVTLTDPLPFVPENVYVGQIMIGIGNLEEKRSIEVSIRCFNGSRNSIFVQRCEGKIKVEEMTKGSSNEIGELPLPWLSDKMKSGKINHGEEFYLLLEQRLTEEIASTLILLGNDPAIALNFDGLSILIGSHRWPEKLERLLLWNGVRISRNTDQVHCGRIISMKAQAGKYSVN